MRKLKTFTEFFKYCEELSDYKIKHENCHFMCKLYVKKLLFLPEISYEQFLSVMNVKNPPWDTVILQLRWVTTSPNLIYRHRLRIGLFLLFVKRSWGCERTSDGDLRDGFQAHCLSSAFPLSLDACEPDLLPTPAHAHTIWVFMSASDKLQNFKTTLHLHSITSFLHASLSLHSLSSSVCSSSKVLIFFFSMSTRTWSFSFYCRKIQRLKITVRCRLVQMHYAERSSV